MTTHGTGAAYRWGCRCVECKRAHADRIKKQRNERKHRPPVQRGVAMTRPLFDVPPIDNGACHPGNILRLDTRERAELGQAIDDLFFPATGPGRPTNNPGTTALTAKLTMCGRCEAIEACRSWILDREYKQAFTDYGVYGGLSQTERDDILRRRQKRPSRKDVA